MWRNDDPREHINKRADILILRPTGGTNYRVGQGQVETKNGWSIWTTFEDHQHIDDWDPLWWWDWVRFPGARVLEGSTIEGSTLITQVTAWTNDCFDLVVHGLTKAQLEAIASIIRNPGTNTFPL